MTESSVTGGRLGGGVLGGGEGGGGGGDGWIVSSLMSPSRYWIDSRLMYVVDVSEKLVGVAIRVKVRVRLRLRLRLRVRVRVRVRVGVRASPGVDGHLAARARVISLL